jgi:NAD(P)H dehydrogenase (quinone)
VIGVTGATGQVGGRVARRLAGRGIDQRLVVRNVARAPQLEGAEVRSTGGYNAADEMRDALDGVETLLLVPAAESPERVDEHRSAIDAAVAAGVQHVVYLSFVSASEESVFTLARDHWETEQHARGAGIAFTFLRMNMYMDFLPTMVDSAGVIRGPARDGRVGFVLRDDLADVAAAVLAEPSAHAERTYEVTGPESISLGDAAATMAEVTGKRIQFEDETVERAWESRRPSGAPDWEIEGWISSYLAIGSGDLDVVTSTVRDVAGHDAVSLEQYLRGTPDALEHVTA